MGCLAIFLNLILPGLGTIFLAKKTGQGFAQIFLAVLNFILGIFLGIVTLGFWAIIAALIHLGIFAWALTSTFTAISEQTARKMYREERERERQNMEP
jgi:fatty acid desaturase